MIRTRTLWRELSSKSDGKLTFKELLLFSKRVGKNSQFLTKLKDEYLDDHIILKRKQKNRYEMEYNAKRLALMTPDVYHRENSVSYTQILQLLRKLTPENLKYHPDDILSFKNLTRYSKVTPTDIPPFPLSLSVEVFREYIRELTTHEYLYRHASRQTVGIVVPLLKNLFKRENEVLKFVRDVESYNMVILYFLKINDLEYAWYLLNGMKEEHILPNATTYNSFLFHLTFHKNRFRVNPLVSVVKILKDMERRKLHANLLTWYLVMKITKRDLMFRTELMNLYKELRLPKTTQLATIEVETLNNNITADELIKIMNSVPRYFFPGHELVHLVLSKLLKENRVNDAWSLLNKQVKLGFNPNGATLKQFLEYFHDLELIQLSLGAFYTFQTRFNVKPTISHFYSLMLATTKTGFHKNWRSMARIIYSEMTKSMGTKLHKAGYWVTRLELRALTDRKCQNKKLILDTPLTPKEEKLLAEIQSGLVWGDKIVIHPSQSKDPYYNKLCISVGVKLQKKDIKQHTTTTTKEDQVIKENYKAKVKAKNLSLNYLQRSKILAKTPLGFLVDELRQRGIVNQNDQLETLNVTKKNGDKNL